MNNSLREKFRLFMNARVDAVQLALEENTQYQNALDAIDDMPDANAVRDEFDTVIALAQNSAYLQGFHDGLSVMAALDV